MLTTSTSQNISSQLLGYQSPTSSGLYNADLNQANLVASSVQPSKYTTENLQVNLKDGNSMSLETLLATSLSSDPSFQVLTNQLTGGGFNSYSLLAQSAAVNSGATDFNV